MKHYERCLVEQAWCFCGYSHLKKQVTEDHIYIIETNKQKYQQIQQQRIRNICYNECIWIWRCTLHEFRYRQFWCLCKCTLLNNYFLKTPFTILMPMKQKSQKQSQWSIQIGIYMSIQGICNWRSNCEVLSSI